MPHVSHVPEKIVLLGATVLVGGALLLFSPWTHPEGFPWSILTSWVRKQEAMNRRNKVLERRNEVGHWRLQAKRQVAVELLLGHLTLLQAAAWFEQLDSQPPDMPVWRLPGQRDSNESYCQHVLNWVRGPLDPYQDPKQDEKARQLEEEFQQLRSQPGGIDLPRPPRLPFLIPCPEP